MTDKEITEIIATKVMGWERTPMAPNNGCWYAGGLNQAVSFAPLGDDRDCMRAWDKLSSSRETTLSNCDNVWFAECSWGRIDGDYLESGSGADRRRAMCECMVKAVKNG